VHHQALLFGFLLLWTDHQEVHDHEHQYQRQESGQIAHQAGIASSRGRLRVGVRNKHGNSKVNELVKKAALYSSIAGWVKTNLRVSGLLNGFYKVLFYK
jgi:hypothetical protein